MRALTIWQPWATLIVAGAKRYEFRQWSYAKRFPWLLNQRVVIHAAARPVRVKDVMGILNRLDTGRSDLNAAIAYPLMEKLLATHKCQGVVEMGAGLGTCEIGRPRSATTLFKGPDVDPDIYAWPLNEITRWHEPVPCRGRQGFWNWPYDGDRAGDPVCPPSTPETTASLTTAQSEPPEAGFEVNAEEPA